MFPSSVFTGLLSPISDFKTFSTEGRVVNGSNIGCTLVLLLPRYYFEGNIRVISLADVTRITVV